MVLFLARRPHVAAVARDAEQLIRRYGAEAYGVAGEMAWRQDAGLLTAPNEGHWHRVHLDIARRLGCSLPSWEDHRSDATGGIPASVGAQAQPGGGRMPAQASDRPVDRMATSGIAAVVR